MINYISYHIYIYIEQASLCTAFKSSGRCGGYSARMGVHIAHGRPADPVLCARKAATVPTSIFEALLLKSFSLKKKSIRSFN